jgi:hypothetical protein
MAKPFFRKEIARYNGSALVSIYRCQLVGERYVQKLVSEYETLGRGATASANREIKKLSAEQVSA